MEHHAAHAPNPRWRRAAWAGALALLLAAALGLFGKGPLSRTSAPFPGDSGDISYDRFLRHHAPTVLRIRVTPGRLPPSPRGSPLRLWIDRTYLDTCRLESIVPEPVLVQSGHDRVAVSIALAEPFDPDAPVEIILRFIVEALDPIDARVGIGDPSSGNAHAVRIRQFVYP